MTRKTALFYMYTRYFLCPLVYRQLDGRTLNVTITHTSEDREIDHAAKYTTSVGVTEHLTTQS